MLTRRAFLQSSGAAGSTLAFTGVLPGIHSIAAAATPPLRRSLGQMDLDDPDLLTLRDFVRIMQEPGRNGDPVSWLSFASIHGTAAGFNKCTHGNWYFLPWHRAYLQMYEAAARSLTGRQEFALPYWDWTSDRQLPRAFSDEMFNGQANPLFVPDRWMDSNASLPDDTVGQVQVMDGVYAETNFEAFGSSRSRDFQQNPQDSIDEVWLGRAGISGTLEQTPHNLIHCIVGGPFMCSAESAQDPLFFMHHGNLDRVWAVWNSLGRQNTDDALWSDMPFPDHFIGTDGVTYTKTVRELLDVEPLGYTFGLSPALPVADMPDRTLALAALFSDPRLLEELGMARSLTPAGDATPQAPLEVIVSPDKALVGLAVDQSLQTVNPGRFIELQAGVPSADSIVSDIRPPQVFAVIRDLDPSAAQTTRLRVFVNCDYLSQATPSSDPHYVTTIGFFGADGSNGHAGHGDGEQSQRSALVNLTPALARLARANRLNTDQIRVQLQPANLLGRSLEEAAPVSVGEVEVIIA